MPSTASSGIERELVRTLLLVGLAILAIVVVLPLVVELAASPFR